MSIALDILFIHHWLFRASCLLRLCAFTFPLLSSSQAPGSKAGGGDEDALDDNKFDEFMGNDAGVFAATGEYDEDDKEADGVWETVDNFMDERRRVRGAGSGRSGGVVGNGRVTDKLRGSAKRREATWDCVSGESGPEELGCQWQGMGLKAKVVKALVCGCVCVLRGCHEGSLGGNHDMRKF